MSLSDSPLGLEQEGWAPASSLHGLEQGVQEGPMGLGTLPWVGSNVFLLRQGQQGGKMADAQDTKDTMGRE